jgi:lipopolysaccharide/colanic/teichoic acid biosynthesis glycosyltransferase
MTVAIDFAVSFTALVFLAPALAVIAAAIKLQDGGPVFEAELRPGRRGAAFTALRFRSRRIDALDRMPRRHDVEMDASCLTPLGSVLRTTGMDEMPLLLNVLRGDMSLVGRGLPIGADIAADHESSAAPSSTGHAMPAHPGEEVAPHTAGTP